MISVIIEEDENDDGEPGNGNNDPLVFLLHSLANYIVGLNEQLIVFTVCFTSLQFLPVPLFTSPSSAVSP